MPTFKHAAFIRRALGSLHAQTLADWELIVVDDGSPDDTADVVAPYLADPRVRYERLPRNEGLGAALTRATALARGRYLAYLPSDDAYYPDHLARLAGLLDREPRVYLAYGGVRWGYGPTLRGERWLRAPTLRGKAAVGHEAETLGTHPVAPLADVLPSGNILALVQVMHRRELEAEVPWPARDVVVSDTLEADFWRALLARGAPFAYTGAITCDWVDHPDQRHKIIAGEGLGAWRHGVSRYRAYYGVGGDHWLNWQPSRGLRVDERARYGRFTERRELPAPGGLKILLVGELGWNPERVLAFEERGHKLYAVWTREPEFWDVVGPFPFGNIDDIPSDASWPERVRAIRPDLIYGLLNWRSLPLIGEVLGAGLGVPLVFHFKEGPFYVQQNGLWPTMMRILRESDAQVFVNEETLEWFQLATDRLLDPGWTTILDGDLPKADWHTDAWTPKLSEGDGEIHTVCAGRFFGLERFEPVARAGIHVHFYGPLFYERELDWVKTGLATGHMHLHPMVEPEGWTRELSRYDAAWSHVVESANGGDLRRAAWDDLNMPARLGTYATAGLPWILKDNTGSRVAVETLARRLDLGVFFDGPEDLAARLRDRPRLAQLTANAHAARPHFAFDTHADALIDLFRRVIAERGA
ncbi:MAG: glycosyltransferase family 2 protein [Chloroflexi bacterium]|nr:glycosyltransferase family 2 protein [Chloroflexota bacterium]